MNDPCLISLEDKMEIHAIFDQYVHLVDGNRGDEWSMLFALNANFDVPGLSVTGRENIATLPDAVFQQSKGKWRHQLTNVVIESASEKNVVNVKAYALVTDWSQDGKLVTFSDFSVRLEKSDTWRIARLEARAP